MPGIAIGQSMKSPVVLVTLALAAAILLTASLLIATGTRGEERRGRMRRSECAGAAAGK